MVLPFFEIPFLIVGNLLTTSVPWFMTTGWGLCLIALSYAHFRLLIWLLNGQFANSLHQNNQPPIP